MSSDYVIELEGLGKTYNSVNALKALDLKVKRNSIYGFIGPNGAGKTTTIKLLLGLIFPTHGNGKVLDMDIKTQSVYIRQHTGYLTQKPSYYKNLNAQEIIEFTSGFYFKGDKSKLRKRISELLEMVELSDKANRPVDGFSGGELQRLGIAQALINEPELLILDEPAASLDPIGRHDVLSLLEKLRGTTTVFYSTHILEDVQRVSDTVGVLNKGELIAQAPIEELLGGSGAIIYNVELLGDDTDAYGRINSFDWVKNIDIENMPNGRKWHVTVENEEKANALLLREILKDNSLTVGSFSRLKYNLEEIFIDMVKGNK